MMIRNQRAWDPPLCGKQNIWWRPDNMTCEPVVWSASTPKETSKEFKLHVQGMVASSRLLRKQYTKERTHKQNSSLRIIIVLNSDHHVVAVGRPVRWKSGIAKLVRENKYRVFEVFFSRTLARPPNVRVPSPRDQPHCLTEEKKAEYHLPYGFASAQGTRPRMEDTHITEVCLDDLIREAMHEVFSHGNSQEGSETHVKESMKMMLLKTLETVKTLQLYCVFDGHRGVNAAQTAKCYYAKVFCQRLCEQVRLEVDIDIQSAIEDALAELESIIISQSKAQGWDSGTTAAVCAIYNGHIYVGNIGDSKAVLMCGDEAIVLTKDHNLVNDAEKQRVQSEGCTIGGGYLNNQLCVTRALGDVELSTGRKLKGLSASPHLDTLAISENSSFLVLACDGLWDVLRPEKVTDFVRYSLNSRKLNVLQAAEELVKLAIRLNATDNITVIIVLLNENKREKRRFPSVNFAALSSDVHEILWGR
mmetsp:Transcript_19735/g.25569  ORF Transcript_19735/g.25569 Transcript_19735/m.25569 type:complete len:475 (+) Transcript_19735:400-1824(+)